MIDALETDLDDAGNKMNVVMASLSKLLKTKDGCQIWTIVILALILIILGICHIYMHIYHDKFGNDLNSLRYTTFIFL